MCERFERFFIFRCVEPVAGGAQSDAAACGGIFNDKIPADKHRGIRRRAIIADIGKSIIVVDRDGARILLEDPARMVGIHTAMERAQLTAGKCRSHHRAP